MIVRCVQSHENGCLPACIAMLLGVSYIKGVRVVHPYRTTKSHLGTYPERLSSVLKRAKLKFRKRRLIPFKELKHNALIVINTGYLHAVVWDYEAQRILDPYPSPKRKVKRHFTLDAYQKMATYVFEIY